jgi:cathepsin D
MLGVEKILIDSNDTRLCSPHAKCKFIVDTGTTIITGPSKSVSKLLQMIPLAQQCKNFYQLPSIGFQVDGVVYTLDVTDYAATIACTISSTTLESQPPDLYVHHPIEEVIGCVSAIMPLDMYERDSPWILGNVFLTKYAVAFDERLRRIGLANNLLL